MHGDQNDVAARLDDSRYAAGHVLLELPSSAEALRHAVGGPEEWRTRVRLPSFEPHAAGTVVRRATREGIIAGVADAVRSRAAAAITPDRHPVVAALPVSIGRTVSEAMARALRDPRFAGERHPRDAGLFGTYEHAQGQALELAAAGADGLQVTVADEIDVADLLAQVRSLVVGATPVLHSRRT